MTERSGEKTNMKKAKISKIGSRGKILLTVLVAIMFIGMASASVIPYFGQVKTTATVEQQAVEIGNGNPIEWHTFNNPIEYTIPHISPGGELFCYCQWVRNKASIPVDVTFNTNTISGITTTYYKPTGYTDAFTRDIDGSTEPLEVTVENGDGWVTWTFDFPVEGWTGDGNLNVGLIIALNGDGNGPAYQIHNNDGTDSSYPWGTWLLSPWGPTINDGWFGWHSSDTNTPITDFDWIEATGNRNAPHGNGGDGILQIKINKCKLGETFHWAASPTVGSGFWEAYDVTMQIPIDFGWNTPIVDMSVPNYIEANIKTQITDLTLQPGEQLLFYICYAFDLHIGIGTYILTTVVDATEA